MSLREQGKDAIVQLLQRHEPLWAQLRQIPQTFDGFLNEFMAYADEQGSEEPGQETVEGVDGVEGVETVEGVEVTQTIEAEAQVMGEGEVLSDLDEPPVKTTRKRTSRAGKSGGKAKEIN